MGGVQGHIRRHHGRALAVAIAGMSLVAKRASGEERLDCVLDSDCTRGPCIDLVCVEGQPVAALPEPPPAEPAPRAAPDENAAPPAAKRRRIRRKGSSRRPPPISTPGGWSEAEAEPPATEPGPEKKVWYGAPLLATYVAPPLAYGSEEGALTFMSLFASPTVHWVNGEVGHGFLSLLMTPLFAGVGWLVGNGACSGSCKAEGSAGMALGYVAWAAIDTGAVAYKKPKRASPRVSLSHSNGAVGTRLEVSLAF